MGENNVWSNMLSNANGQYIFFRKIWRYQDNRKELLLHVYISKPAYFAKTSLQNTIQGYRNIALILLLKQTTLKFIVSGERMGVDFMALSVILCLYNVEWCFIIFHFIHPLYFSTNSPPLTLTVNLKHFTYFSSLSFFPSWILLYVHPS